MAIGIILKHVSIAMDDFLQSWLLKLFDCDRGAHGDNDLLIFHFYHLQEVVEPRTNDRMHAPNNNKKQEWFCLKK